MNTQYRSVCGLYLPNPSDIGTPIKYIDYNGVCYLGRESLEPYSSFYERFKRVGTRKFEDLEDIPVIGISERFPVAAIISNEKYDELVESLNVEPSPEIIPFILAVVAIDAGLIATMWAQAM